MCYTARTHVSTQYCQSVLPALLDEPQPRTSIRLWWFCSFGSCNAQGFAMKEPTSVILALWTKGKNNPRGLLVKDLRGHAVPDFYSKGISTVLIDTLIIFSVPLFSSNFLKFWKSSVYFGHRIAKYTKQFMGQWQSFSSPCVKMPNVPLEPVQCLWDVCLCAHGAKVMVVPFWYLIFFFIQNICPQCGNSPVLLAL